MQFTTLGKSNLQFLIVIIMSLCWRYCTFESSHNNNYNNSKGIHHTYFGLSVCVNVYLYWGLWSVCVILKVGFNLCISFQLFKYKTSYTFKI